MTALTCSGCGVVLAARIHGVLDGLVRTSACRACAHPAAPGPLALPASS